MVAARKLGPILNTPTKDFTDIVLEFDGPVSLLAVEAALGEACRCASFLDNKACNVHRALEALAAYHDRLAFDLSLDFGIEKDNAVETAKEEAESEQAKAEEKLREREGELEEARGELKERDEENISLRAQIDALRKALGNDAAEKVLGAERLEENFSVREKEARAAWQVETRTQIHNEFKEWLAAEKKRADDAEGKLRRSKTWARYEKAKTAASVPVPIPSSAVTAQGKDIYEAARHLAMQPSGLQALLEVARAQRPAEFKKRGK